jgi:cell division protein FtsI/penicillin-binding protein 2
MKEIKKKSNVIKISKKIDDNLESKEKASLDIGENWRYILLFVFAILPFLYLSVNLFKVQVLQYDYYKNIRDKQYKLLPQSIDDRGVIYAEKKNGELVELATNKKEYVLVLSPKDVDKKYIDIIFKLVNNITEIDKNTFIQKSEKQNDSYEELKDLTLDEAKKIKDLKINGINVKETQKRSYPLSDIGSQVIGFVGDGEGGVKGRYGLEKYYNDILQKVGQDKTSFFASLFNDIQNGEIENDNKKIEDSLSIVTTIEPNVLKFLNNELKSIYSTWRPDMVAGMIINTKTGEIVAMDSIPNFDPNSYKDFAAQNFNNPNVQGIYELGSIMKPVTVSGGIENKLITPETIYRDTGKLEIDGYTIKNYDNRAWGDMSMQGALEHSLNLGMIFIMRKMGFEKFREDILNFKFDEETGVDLPGEVSNRIQNIFGNTEVNFATAAFGQGIATSPISMMRALNAIANDGKLVNPHLLKKQIDKDDNFLDIIFQDKKSEMAVSEETAKIVKRMMVLNLDHFASGKYSDKKYGMGVKTGTGQLVKPGGGYYTDKTLHSYFAFLPEKNTEFSVLIFQVNPKVGQSSSETLTKHIQNIKNFLISYYNIPPER